MGANDNAGRISKQSFFISTLILLGICIVSAAFRFYIRLGIQKQFSIEDGLLIFGLCCIICAEALTLIYADGLYLSEALVLRIPNTQLPVDWMQVEWSYGDGSTAALVLSWCSIVTVKFSFLFLFRKLVDRLRYMKMYWWVVAVFNALVSIYAATVYVVACPYYDNPKSFTCSGSSYIWRVIDFSLAAMILDIVGDLLILVIPIRIIWQIQVRWTQKLVLSFSLCLTIIMIVITIVRASGLHHTTEVTGTYVDPVWEIFWQLMSAEVGLILVAVTSFRTFFVANSNTKAAQNAGGEHKYLSNTRRFLLRLITPRTWRSESEKRVSDDNNGGSSGGLDELPSVPRAEITGLRSFILGQGRRMRESRIMESEPVGDETGDVWPLTVEGAEAKRVRQEVYDGFAV